MLKSTLYRLMVVTGLAMASDAWAQGGGGGPAADPAIVFYDMKGGLAVMNADGARKTTVLKASSGSFWFPCWSPDGGSVCFGISATVSGVPYRGVAALDVGVVGGAPTGSHFRVLVTSSTFAFPAWSPDGTRIAYTQPGAIYCIPAAGGTPTVLYAGSDVGSTPIAWSPDGAQIAYGSGGTTSAIIKVLNVADGSTFQVCALTAPGGMIAGQLDWGRTAGNVIVFHADRSTSASPPISVYAVAATPGATPQLISTNAWFPTWSPDDTRVVYSVAGGNDSIVVRNLLTGAVTSTGGRGRMANWRRW